MITMLFFVKFLFGQRAEQNFRPVADNGFQLQRMIARTAVKQRMCSAGIISHHSAHHTAIGGGGLRAEKQTVRFEYEIHLVEHHTGFDPYPSFICVDFQNTVHVFGHIHHNAVSHHLSGQRCPGTPRDQRYLLPACKTDQLTDIILVFGTGNSQRKFTVNRCIGSIQYPRGKIGKQITV